MVAVEKTATRQAQSALAAERNQRESKQSIQPGHSDPAISDLGVTTSRHAALLEGRAPTGPTSPARDTRREASRRVACCALS